MLQTRRGAVMCDLSSMCICVSIMDNKRILCAFLNVKADTMRALGIFWGRRIGRRVKKFATPPPLSPVGPPMIPLAKGNTKKGMGLWH